MEECIFQGAKNVRNDRITVIGSPKKKKEKQGAAINSSMLGQFLPKIEAALDGKSKGHKLKIEIPINEEIGRAHV